MYTLLTLAQKYLYYHATASNGRGHGIHSPFVFNFIRSILNDKKRYPAYAIIEKLRRQLLNDATVLTVQDLGAGSGTGKSSQRSMTSIAKHAVKPAKYGQLLYRIVQYFQPETILELGTSLGITTSYLSLAKPDATVITLEGSPAIAAAARHNFRALNCTNIKLVEGDFNHTLPALVNGLPSIDLAFIDGNHRQQPTIDYFNSILSRTNQFSIVILDDIHWSAEMEQAWITIKNHPSVKCSVDLFFIGIIFFRDDFKEQQHFTVRF